MDLQHAKTEFERYLDGYDRNDDKVHLKIVHTYGVTEYSRQIAERLNLPDEDRELAQLIGLLHDIGRFEQLKRFDSFEPDTMDHASFGVQILFSEGMIRNFAGKDSWDGIIQTAIARHSDFRLTGITDSRTLMHARIIRDADKLDNCRSLKTPSKPYWASLPKRSARIPSARRLWLSFAEKNPSSLP